MTIHDLPLGPVQAPIPVPHFPAIHQAVIWRNWPLLTAERLAKTLGCPVAELSTAAEELGLGEAATPELERRWLQRGYITLIRQNWHLLPYEQLLTMLGWTAEQLDFALREDDFLWNKLSQSKPRTPPVRLRSLTAEEQARTAAIRQLAEQHLAPPETPPFAFIDDLSEVPAEPATADRHGPLRLVYSYCAVYGDPLLDPELDPYPDGLLPRLADNGVNAIWLQGTLYTLVPWLGETRHSAGHETRLKNLNALIQRAASFGIGVYLYLNEPRAMPADFYEDHPDWKGSYTPSHDTYSPCLANPEVETAFRDGLVALANGAPDLAGVFSITVSENPTHCLSHYNRPHTDLCPHCRQQSPADLVARVNNLIAESLHSVDPRIQVLAWNWSWDPSFANDVSDQLRPDVTLMCTSETYLPTMAMGARGLVSDYSMSKPGPGPLAEGQWEHAQTLGLRCAAKVQLNNTWENSAVPYLPVPYLVQEHLRKLRDCGINDFMISWTLGGYPGGNLPLLDETPEALAERDFGATAAPHILRAWHTFSEAFAEFPFHASSFLYTGPQNYGPMNHLHATPTGYRATMIGYPYDDLATWCGRHFTEHVADEQFRKLSEGWRLGVQLLEAAAPLVPEAHRPAIDDLLSVARAAYCHFRSTWLQIRFTRQRGKPLTAPLHEELHAIVDEEKALALQLLDLQRRDSRLGYESSNHYYYTQTSLLEKVLNLHHLRQLSPLS